MSGFPRLIRIWDVENGRLLAERLLDDPLARLPLDITFDLRNQLYLRLNNAHCII